MIHITRQNPEVAPNKAIDLLTKDAKFDLCNGIDDLKTTWAQFSATVLTEGLENMTKKDFDEQYTIDQRAHTVLMLLVILLGSEDVQGCS